MKKLKELKQWETKEAWLWITNTESLYNLALKANTHGHLYRIYKQHGPTAKCNINHVDWEKIYNDLQEFETK